MSEPKPELSPEDQALQNALDFFVKYPHLITAGPASRQTR